MPSAGNMAGRRDATAGARWPGGNTSRADRSRAAIVAGLSTACHRAALHSRAMMRWLPLLSIAAACSATGADPRTGFLVNTLTDDNQAWLDRDPDALAGKYRKMATRGFDFFRGTAPQYWRDVTEAGPLASATAVGDASSAWLWIVGDPHLENLGTFRSPDGVIAIDWNDFDAATVGPWWLDLRRLAVSLVLATDELDLGAAADRALVDAAVEAYVGEIERLAAGGAPRLESLGNGEVADDLVASATRSGDRRLKLDDYTRVDEAGARTMFYGDVVPPRDDGVWVDSTALIREPERATVEAAVEAWRSTALVDDAGAMKGVSRRLGAGVASYPVPRYYVLLEGATASADDDVLIELKETLDPPRVAGLGPAALLGTIANGERVTLAQRVLGARVDADVLLGHGEVLPLSYRVRARTGYQRGFDLADAAGDRDAAIALAALTGRSLARAHAMAPVPRAPGERGLDRIAPRVIGRGELLIEETGSFAMAYAEIVRADAVRFAAVLDERGARLGAP